MRRSQVEGVSHRLLLDDQFADLTVVEPVAQHTWPAFTICFAFVPQDFSLAQQSDGRYYYSLHLETELSGPDNKIIYTDTQELQHIFTQNQIEPLKNKSFGAKSARHCPREISATCKAYQ